MLRPKSISSSFNKVDPIQPKLTRKNYILVQIPPSLPPSYFTVCNLAYPSLVANWIIPSRISARRTLYSFAVFSRAIFMPDSAASCSINTSFSVAVEIFSRTILAFVHIFPRRLAFDRGLQRPQLSCQGKSTCIM